MCGIVGIVSKSGNVIDDAIVLLNAENNRGERACGAATFDGHRLHCYRDEGLVAQVFGSKNIKRREKLKGSSCIAHTLYSTIGRGGERKQPHMFQPVVFNFHGRRGAIGHNGNLVRLEELRGQIKKAGYKFKSEASDTEVIAGLLSTSKEKDFLAALIEVLKKIEGKGAFSLVVLFRGKVFGVRDQNGIRPLCMGKKNGGGEDSYILASESSVFPAIKSARFVREIAPGELIVLGAEGIEKSIRWTKCTKCKFCVAELIYFSNPATCYFGKSVYAFRAKAGQIMAKNHPVDAEVIVPVPNSGRGYSNSYSFESGILSDEGLMKSNYSLRTFMTPRDEDRSKKQRAKLQALPDVMAGKSVCLIEDSVFRGSVLRPVVSLSRIHGRAREVHVRVCSPPAKFPCHQGLDTSTKQELIASRMTVAQIRDEYVHADSLEYLTIEELKQVLSEIGLSPDDFCLGCFSGEYPVKPPDENL